MDIADARTVGHPEFRMKVAMVAPDDLSTIIFCKTLAKLLTETNGAKVFTVSSLGRYRSEVGKLCSIHVALPMSRYVSPIHDLFYSWRLYRILREEGISTIITFTTKPNIYGAVVARLAGVRTIVAAVRGLGRSFSKAETFRDHIVNKLVVYLYRLSLRCADLVWFTNRNDRAFFLKGGDVTLGRSFQTANAVDLEEFNIDAVDPAALLRLQQELSIGPDNLVVIMVARLIWSKGIREYVGAAKSLSAELPHVKFLLVAPTEDGAADAVPESYIHGAEDSANLQWIGFRKDVRDLYALAHIAVLPSYYKEGGYPRALLEPMAMGKPVIAADTVDCRNPVEDGVNGFLVPPKNTEALTQRIRELLLDEGLREKYGLKSLEKARREYDDRSVVREVISILLRFASRRSTKQ